HGLGKALGKELGGRIAVGRDCRLSSDRLFAALTKGLMDAGAHVIDVGVGPTPKLYFAAHHLGTDGGIMITGSHNPADENGFKIVKSKDFARSEVRDPLHGREIASFFGAAIQAIRKKMEADDFATAPNGSISEENIDDAYVNALTKDIQLDPSMKVVLDAG